MHFFSQISKKNRIFRTRFGFSWVLYIKGTAKSEENGHRKKGYEEHRKTGRIEVDSAKRRKHAFVRFLTGFMQCAVYESDERKILVLSIF